jgi:hypothetical protein
MNDTLQKIEFIASQPTLNNWEKNFLISIKDQYIKKNSLSDAQMNHLNNIGQRFTPDAIKQRDDWYASWNDEKKDNFKKIVDYYLNSVYYTSITRKVQENPDYVPTEKEYDTLVNNKYAQRYLNNLNSTPKYQVGDLVQIRSSWYRQGEIGTIIEVRNVDSWVTGSRKYLVNLLGEDDAREWEERGLKKFRESSLDKKNEKTV